MQPLGTRSAHFVHGRNSSATVPGVVGMRRRRRDRCRKHPPPPAANADTNTASSASVERAADDDRRIFACKLARRSDQLAGVSRDARGQVRLIGRLTLTPQNGSSIVLRAVLPGEFTMDEPYSGRNSGISVILMTAPAGILPEGLTSLGPATIVGSWDINPSVATFTATLTKASCKLSVSA